MNRESEQIIPERSRISLLDVHSHSDVALNGMEPYIPDMVRVHRAAMSNVIEDGKSGAVMWLPYETSRGLVGRETTQLLFGEKQVRMLAAYHHPVDNRWGGREGIRLEDADTICTFPPAKRQCEQLILRHSHASLDTEVDSTADAARKVAQQYQNGVAIGTAAALHAYNLTVSEETANDVPPDENITSFGLWQFADEPILPDIHRTYHAATVTLNDYPGALRDLTRILRPVDLVSLRSDAEIGESERSFFIEMQPKETGTDVTQLEEMVYLLEQYSHLVKQVMWRGSYNHVIYADGNGHEPERPTGRSVAVDVERANLQQRYHHVILTPYNTPGVLNSLLDDIATAGIDLQSFYTVNEGHRRYAFDMIFDTQKTHQSSVIALIGHLSRRSDALQSLIVRGSFDEPQRG